jgi:hypothetical protein
VRLATFHAARPPLEWPPARSPILWTETSSATTCAPMGAGCAACSWPMLDYASWPERAGPGRTHDPGRTAVLRDSSHEFVLYEEPEDVFGQRNTRSRGCPERGGGRTCGACATSWMTCVLRDARHGDAHLQLARAERQQVVARDAPLVVWIEGPVTHTGHRSLERDIRTGRGFCARRLATISLCATTRTSPAGKAAPNQQCVMV